MKKEYINEIWKPIKGYEGLYEVSNFGRIKSLKRLVKSHNKWGDMFILINEKILKKRIDKYGYERVMLCKHGKSELKQVHRLVAEAFIPNPYNLPQVNHKDEDKTNNNVDNLEWCDIPYNVRYGTGIERRSKKRSKPVLQFTLDGELIKEWKSTAECGRNGYNYGAVAACCRGKLKKYKNFIWKYK